MKNLYTAQVSVSSGRDGAATSSDGRLSVSLGLPKELGGDGTAPNPEQLFVAGFAACFASSIKAASAAKSVSVSNVTVDAAGTLSVNDDGAYLISAVTLTVRADGLGDAAAAVIAEAKRICAYANATRGNVLTEVVCA